MHSVVTMSSAFKRTQSFKINEALHRVLARYKIRALPSGAPKLTVGRVPVCQALLRCLYYPAE